MDLLYCDETNLDRRSGEFFVYGGLMIPGQSAKALSDAIYAIRKAARVDPHYRLKFNPAPAGMPHAKFNDLKESVITAAVEHGAILLVSAILHDVARNADDARRKAINTVCYHFDCMLNRRRESGIVLIDRFTDAQIDSHLVEKFSIGLTGLPYSREYRLANVVGFHYSVIGQAHFPSLIDIVLGSLRFAINAFTRGDRSRLASAKKVLSLIAPLFYRQEWNNAVSELSFIFSPKTIRAKSYRTKYLDLKNFLADNGIVTAQEIPQE